jgi:hypothetical protein
MNKAKFFGAVATLALLGGCASINYETVKRVPAATVTSFAAGDVTVTVEVSKLVFAIERGTEYGQVGLGLACLPGPKLKWEGSTSAQSEGPMIQAARDAFTKAGIRLAGNPTQLFNVGADSVGELVVAAKIEKIDIKTCGANTFTGQIGVGYVQVEWQVLSRLTNTVVFTHRNEGSFETTKHQPGGALWISGAFEESAKHLLANKEFRELLTKPRSSPAPRGTPT